MKITPPLAPEGRKMGIVARLLTFVGLGAAAYFLFLFAVLLYIVDMRVQVSPVELYHQTWEEMRDNAYDPKMLKNWDQWEHKYDSQIKTDEDAIKYANEMIESTGDHYAGLLPPADVTAERERATGRFAGIGVEIGARTDGDDKPVFGANKDEGPLAKSDDKGNPEVVRVIPDGPSAKAGLKDGDHIIAIDGQTMRNATMKALVDKLRGKPGEVVSLEVERDGKNQTIKVVRGEVKTQTVSHKMLTAPNGKKIGYIRLEDFSNEESPDDMVKAVKALDSDKVIIDLRFNPGGEVQVCMQLVPIFLKEGVMVSLREHDHGEYDATTFSVDDQNIIMKRSVESTGKSRTSTFGRTEGAGVDKEIVILVNGHSASAAEMFTGALKDNKRAVVVGERTFGKGIGQSVIPMPNGTSLHVTSLRYYTPSGKWLGDGGNSKESYGIEPDYEVKLDSKPGVKLGGPKDNQLNFALDLLSK